MRATLDLNMVKLGIDCDAGQLIGIEFLAPDAAEISPEPGSLAAEVARQISLSRRHAGFCFDLPICLRGSPFQLKVWQALAEIPFGSVKTYGELARELGTSARAIGGACRRNPLPVVIPCHRIVAASGLGGFSGDAAGGWTSVKRALLSEEGVVLASVKTGLAPV